MTENLQGKIAELKARESQLKALINFQKWNEQVTEERQAKPATPQPESPFQFLADEQKKKARELEQDRELVRHFGKNAGRARDSMAKQKPPRHKPEPTPAPSPQPVQTEQSNETVFSGQRLRESQAMAITATMKKGRKKTVYNGKTYFVVAENYPLTIQANIQSGQKTEVN